MPGIVRGAFHILRHSFLQKTCEVVIIILILMAKDEVLEGEVTCSCLLGLKGEEVVFKVM